MSMGGRASAPEIESGRWEFDRIDGAAVGKDLDVRAAPVTRKICARGAHVSGRAGEAPRGVNRGRGNSRQRSCGKCTCTTRRDHEQKQELKSQGAEPHGGDADEGSQVSNSSPDCPDASGVESQHGPPGASCISTGPYQTADQSA